MGRVIFGLLIVLCLTAATARAGQRVVAVGSDAQLRAALGDLKAGDQVQLKPGVYRGGLAIHNAQGTADAPILIAAADPEDPPVLRGGTEVLHLTDVAHLELRDLILEKSSHNGLNIDDGGSYETPSHHVTLRRLTVCDVGSTGNHDGIKLSGVNDFAVVDCTVERWGKAGSGIDMVGCHRGRIEGTTFRHRPGEGHNGVQAKGGTADVVVRSCRFESAGERAVQIGGSTGLRFFRPPHPKTDAWEAARITVEGCTFIGSAAAVAFVSCQDSVFRFNTVYRPTRWAIRILSEQRAEGFIRTRRNTVSDNLFVWRPDEMHSHVNVGDHTEPQTFTFARNAWASLTHRGDSRPSLPVKETDPVVGRVPRFVDEAKLDLRQRDESPTRRHGADALPDAKPTTP